MQGLGSLIGVPFLSWPRVLAVSGNRPHTFFLPCRVEQWSLTDLLSSVTSKINAENKNAMVLSSKKSKINV